MNLYEPGTILVPHLFYNAIRPIVTRDVQNILEMSDSRNIGDILYMATQRRISIQELIKRDPTQIVHHPVHMFRCDQFAVRGLVYEGVR